jgi:F-type H+-transporting ATPase subunit epsilon
VSGTPSTSLKVVLLTPRSKLLDCRAEGVVIPCSDGMRGILHNHCPLLSSLQLGIMQVQGISDKQDKTKAWFILEGGFACFSENSLTVLAYDAITFEGLAPEKVQDMISKAKSAVSSQEAIKTQDERLDMTRNRLIVRMAEMASLIIPEAS